jgi:hypothetical protein
VTEGEVPDPTVGGDTLSEPTVALLRSLNLLPSKADMEKGDGLGAAFRGPPDSVALIEAGATAATKWWATGLGAAVIGAWGAVTAWWDDQDAGTQRVALGAAGLVTAAALLGIAYLLASDVRGRAAATGETIRARATVADAFVRTAGIARTGNPVVSGGGAGAGLWFTALPAPLGVRYHAMARRDESGWRAVAVATDGDQRTRYLVVKGTRSAWADAEAVEFS